MREWPGPWVDFSKGEGLFCKLESLHDLSHLCGRCGPDLLMTWPNLGEERERESCWQFVLRRYIKNQKFVWSRGSKTLFSVFQLHKPR